MTQMMKVEVAGKLMRDEDKKDEDDNSAPAWGVLKEQKSGLNEKRYPSLAKAVASSNINIDDNTETKINISTTKNVFSALEDPEADDEKGSKRPKEIMPSKVQKKKGERERVAVQREVDKYSKKGGSGKDRDSIEEGDEGEEGEEEEEEVELVEEEKKKTDKKPSKKVKAAKEEVEEEEEEAAAEEERVDEEDLKIECNQEASEAKYKGRKKLPLEDLPAEEMREQKETRRARPQTSSKKKKAIFDEDLLDPKSKLQVWQDD